MKALQLLIALFFVLTLTGAGIAASPEVTAAGTGKAGTERLKSGSNAVDQDQLENRIIILNSADEAELSTLPGVGPKTAEAIVRYRNENGGFSSVDDLLKVKGIGEKKLAKMRAYLKV
jgi:competence protein ComEA